MPAGTVVELPGILIGYRAVSSPVIKLKVLTTPVYTALSMLTQGTGVNNWLLLQ
jgi:hypothetical protein